VPLENQSARVTGFKAPDNLANGLDGKLWIVDDNAGLDQRGTSGGIPWLASMP
jgi:hypothetical protein